MDLVGYQEGEGRRKGRRGKQRGRQMWRIRARETGRGKWHWIDYISLYKCMKFSRVKPKDYSFKLLWWLSHWHIHHESARTAHVHVKTHTGTSELAVASPVKWKPRSKVSNTLCYCQAWDSTWKRSKFIEQGLLVKKSLHALEPPNHPSRLSS